MHEGLEDAEQRVGLLAQHPQRHLAALAVRAFYARRSHSFRFSIKGIISRVPSGHRIASSWPSYLRSCCASIGTALFPATRTFHLRHQSIDQSNQSELDSPSWRQSRANRLARNGTTNETVPLLKRQLRSTWTASPQTASKRMFSPWRSPRPTTKPIIDMTAMVRT